MQELRDRETLQDYTPSIEKIIFCALQLNKKLDVNLLKIQATILVKRSLNYMHRKEFPQQLIEPLAEQLVLSNLNRSSVRKVTEGDITIEYNKVADGTFESVRTQLNAFRKVGVI